MSVEVYNYRARNVLYHLQSYFSIIDGAAQDIREIIYPGYISGVDPRIIAMSEWENLSEPCYQGGTLIHEYSRIQGTIDGFTNDTTVYHGPLHMVLSDGDNYGLGFSIVLYTASVTGVKQFWVCAYVYDSAQGGYWHLAGDWRCYKEALETYETVYANQPEYLYLAMRYSDNPSNPRYPYPYTGGIFYTDANGNDYLSMDGSGFENYLIPALVRAGYDTDINPDPQPSPIQNDDPYAPGGSSWTGGGDGSFDPTGDDVGIPDLPDISATSTGFITLFNPSVSQLNNLCNYMWSDLFDLDTFKKIFADPMQCILGLSIVPLDVPSGGSAHVKVGNIDTGVSMTKASKQYVEVDCGSVSIEEYSGSYLDYDPYTEIQIYLPYVGIHPLKTDDVMGKTVTVKYHVDILSGACVAYVKCGASVLYSFVGQCSSSIPITGNDWTNVINGALSIAASIGSMVATGGANAPTQVANIASTAVNSMKPQVEKSGSMSGTGGLMAIQTPYLIITRPHLAIPEGQNRYTGYPSYINVPLRSIKGYTEVEKIHLDNIPCTESELNEIEKLLKGGVIL